MRTIERLQPIATGAGIIVLALTGLFVTSAVSFGGGNTYEVNSTADAFPGVCDLADCTLREAIGAANATPGLDTITFDPAVFPEGTPATICRR